MRIVLPLIALAVTTAAAPAPHTAAPTPAIDAPRAAGERVCRDRIQTVRDERGLPRLDRDNTKPDEALLIAAVDQRIDGCSIMVMRNNTSDVRPIPTAPDGPPRVQRIPGQ